MMFKNSNAVRLKSHLGKYLAADHDAETVDQRSSGSSKDVIWTVESVEGKQNIFRLKSCHGLYLTASEEMLGKKVLQTVKRDASTEWELLPEENSVKLRTKDGKFLMADDYTTLVTHDFCDRTETQDCAKWHAVDVSDDQYLPSFSSAGDDDYSANWPALPSKFTPLQTRAAPKQQWSDWSSVLSSRQHEMTYPSLNLGPGLPSQLFGDFSGSPNSKSGDTSMEQDAMEIFRRAEAVRLRSRLGPFATYLVADENKPIVYHTVNGADRWTVEHVEGKHNTIRLKSGRGLYLTAANEPFIRGLSGRKVLQTLPEKKADINIEWQPVGEGSAVKLRTSNGNFLRANESRNPWCNSVTHDVPDIGRQLWEVDVLDISDPDSGCFSPSSSMVLNSTKSRNMAMEQSTSNQNTMTEEVVVNSPKHLQGFISFCSMFPSDYEFTKDILVWQWIAGGLVKMTEDETMENVCVEHFNTLLSMDYIVASGYDHLFDQKKYRIGDLQKIQPEPTFRKHLDSQQSDVAKVQHLSLASVQTDGIEFVALKRYTNLQSLFMNYCYGSGLKYLPSDFFLELKALKILNLSRTNIVALPCSVENLKELRFLDVSETPLSWLPETIRCFSHLQTLKLDGCLSLHRLPKCSNKLINLRHIVLDVARQLQSMPVGIGKLSKLQTLSAYLIGEDDGCQIGELKDMNNLRGSLRILNLENVKMKEKVGDACLFNKLGLKKLELQWSDLCDEKHTDEEDILESLQPPFGIQELKIMFYSGGVFPSWISNPLFGELVKIVLYRCRYCYSLPSLGELPSLKDLCIIENNEVNEIDNIFCRNQISDHQQHYVAFPKLEKLSFDSMLKLEKCTGVENSDFPSLSHLVIENCPKFGSLPVLSHLKTLLNLEISYCPELSCLPEGGLPSTLELFMIKDCPKLIERCRDERCEDWPKVAHVPDFYINNQKVSP